MTYPPARAAIPPMGLTLPAEDLRAKLDVIDDGDALADMLERALMALVDICGSDPARPRVATPTKTARRALTAISRTMDEIIDQQAVAKEL